MVPQLESIRGDIRAMDEKFMSKFGAVEGRLQTIEAKFGGKFDALEAKFDGRFDTVDAKFDVLEARIAAIDTKVESFRRELASEIRRVEETFSGLCPDRRESGPAARK